MRAVKHPRYKPYDAQKLVETIEPLLHKDKLESIVASLQETNALQLFISVANKPFASFDGAWHFQHSSNSLPSDYDGAYFGYSSLRGIRIADGVRVLMRARFDCFGRYLDQVSDLENLYWQKKPGELHLFDSVKRFRYDPNPPIASIASPLMDTEVEFVNLAETAVIEMANSFSADAL